MKQMIRGLLLSGVLFGSHVFAQQQQQMTDEQKCQFECGRKMMECKRPCAPKSQDDFNNPKKKDSFLACSKECNKEAQPCLDACKKEKKK